MRFSNSGSTASGVTSRPVKPVPPVVMITSIPGSAIQARTRAWMLSLSSGTISRPATRCPAAVTRSERVIPDLSSAGVRVSETVSTATRIGFRTVAIHDRAFYVNDRPIMFHGEPPRPQRRAG